MFMVNELTAKDSFEIAKYVLNENTKYFMASLDLDLLSIIAPPDQTIKRCVDELCENESRVQVSK